MTIPAPVEPTQNAIASHDGSNERSLTDLEGPPRNGERASSSRHAAAGVAGAAGDSLDNFIVNVNDIAEADDEQRQQVEDLSLRDPKTLTMYERKILKWETSPFAVGRVNASWKDDRTNGFRPAGDGRDPRVCFSAYVCGCLGARRVGNLAVLAQTTEEYDHLELINEETNEYRTTRKTRPKLLWVIGPYWYVNLCLTFPLIVGISLWTAMRHIMDSFLVVQVTWSAATLLMIFSLIMAGCRNPGVLYRHSHPPPNTRESWTWNDQAKTYRPSSARFDPECQAIIEGFDHTYVFFCFFVSCCEYGSFWSLPPFVPNAYICHVVFQS